jgi:PEP-CTERM motif
MKIRTPFVATLAAAAMALLAAGNASAHAVSIGYANAGPGSVTVWLGTYNHGTPTNEGSLQLQGANGTVYGPVTTAFNLLAVGGAKPAGLIDGVTNFYAPDANVGGSAPLVGSEAGFNAGCPACGPVEHWQGVTFAGLTAGDYQFTWIPAANASAEWSPLNTNMNGIFNLSGVVNPTPEPATLALVGVALAGLGFASRRRAA